MFWLTAQVDDCYKPNHHIFYADRVGDAADGLPKWQTLPEGQCLVRKRFYLIPGFMAGAHL
jgi:hypothetical protein